jgi:hypothetical protein
MFKTSLSATGAPVLNINAANTNVPLKERQRMVTVVYEVRFLTWTLFVYLLPGRLFESCIAISQTALILLLCRVGMRSPKRPKFTPGLKERRTRTCVDQSTLPEPPLIFFKSQNGAHTIATIKKRPRPNNISHPSVGTQGTLDARRAEAELAKNSTLLRNQIERALLSRQQLSQWGFLVEVPDGPGGTRVSDEGKEATCERCQTLFVVRGPQSVEEAQEMSQRCTHHWGRTYLSKTGGK